MIYFVANGMTCEDVIDVPSIKNKDMLNSLLSYNTRLNNIGLIHAVNLRNSNVLKEIIKQNPSNVNIYAPLEVASIETALLALSDNEYETINPDLDIKIMPYLTKKKISKKHNFKTVQNDYKRRNIKDYWNNIDKKFYGFGKILYDPKLNWEEYESRLSNNKKKNYVGIYSLMDFLRDKGYRKNGHFSAPSNISIVFCDYRYVKNMINLSRDYKYNNIRQKDTLENCSVWEFKLDTKNNIIRDKIYPIGIKYDPYKKENDKFVYYYPYKNGKTIRIELFSLTKNIIPKMIKDYLTYCRMGNKLEPYIKKAPNIAPTVKINTNKKNKANKKDSNNKTNIKTDNSPTFTMEKILEI